MTVAAKTIQNERGGGGHKHTENGGFRKTLCCRHHVPMQASLGADTLPLVEKIGMDVVGQGVLQIVICG